MQILEDTTAVLSLGTLCEEHGYSYEWASGQKPHLTKNGTTILCKTENFVPVVVPGLSSRSSANSSSTSFPQNSSSTVSSPASLRSDEQASGNRRDPQKPNPPLPPLHPKRTTNKQRETACETSQSGERSSQKIWRTQKCLHPHTILMTQNRNVLRKWHQRSKICMPISQKTEIAQSAREPRLQGPLAESEMAKQYLGQKNSVT